MRNNYFKLHVLAFSLFSFFLCSGSIFAQQKTVSGKVVDEQGVPLPSVTVSIKGASRGTVTDFDGLFSLQASPNEVLVFSFIGFEPQEIPVNDQTSFEVSLSENQSELSEVVVVGYGTARKKDVTGSISTLDLEDSPQGNFPNTNPLQVLRGTTAGINVGPQTSPGRTPGILVRGQNSINGDNAPLLVVDGIVFLGSIQDINPSDIATLTILKDASAAAVYGSRASNGVIMITTKKGKMGKPVIKFASSIGVNTWQNKFDMMNLDQFRLKYAAQQGLESPDDIVFDGELANEYLRQGINTNWMDLISRNGVISNQEISISGRSDKINYYLSGAYNTSEGAIKGDDFKRISLRSKVVANVTDWLELGVDGTYNNNDYSGVGANVYNAYLMPPYGFPYRYQGMPFGDASATNSRELERWPIGQSIQNPLWGTDGTVEDVERSDFYRFAGYGILEVPQIDGLSYQFNYSINVNYGERDQFFFEDYFIEQTAANFYIDRYSPNNLQQRLSLANGYNNRIKDYTYVLNNIIDYKKDFGDHYLNATLVATRDYNKYRNVFVRGTDYSRNGNTSLGINGIHKAENVTSDIGVTERSNVGYLGRINYSYNNRYHLTGSIRRDGSSVFGAENKWGNFPSIGVAWTISNESFLENNAILSNLKLKASYGRNGNQGLQPYQTLARVVNGVDGGIYYEFGNSEEIFYGIQQSSLANPNLGWETTTAFNGGFESSWFNNRINLNLDFYFSKTTDQIFLRQIPIFTGFENIFSSLGQVDNRGIEVTLDAQIVTKEDFSWNATLSAWQNRNKISRLYGTDADGDGREDDDIGNSLFIGEPISAIYGYEYLGVVQSSDQEYIEANTAIPGDPMFRDLNGDGVINADGDRKILGYRQPNFRMSLQNTINYKNFNFYFLLNGIFGGNGYYLQENPKHNSFAGAESYSNEIDHGWWTPENESTEFLRPDYRGGRYAGLQSRGFLRIQDISLSYNMTNVVDFLNLSRFQISANAQNVYTFTNWYGGGDPEAGITPGSGAYPVPSVYSLGVNVSF